MSIYCRVCGSVQPVRNASTSCSSCGAYLGPHDNDLMQPDEVDDGTTFFNGLVAGVIALVLAGIAAVLLMSGKIPFELADSQEPSPRRWTDFRHTGQLFEASFPAEPVYTSNDFFSPAGSITIHCYVSRQEPDGGEYCIAYFQIPPDVQFDREGALKGAVKFGTRDMQRFVTSRMKFAGYPAMEVRGESDAGDERVVYVFRAGSRWYTVGAEGASRGDRFKFFSSVDIRGPRHQDAQVAIWVPYDCPQGRFRCEFPETPTVQEAFRDLESSRAYVAREDSGGAGGTYTVFYRDLDRDETQDHRATIDQALTSIEFPATHSASDEIAVNGFPGRHVEWHDAASDKISAARLVVAEGRLYGVLAESVSEDQSGHFYNKFRVVKQQAVDRAKDVVAKEMNASAKINKAVAAATDEPKEPTNVSHTPTNGTSASPKATKTPAEPVDRLVAGLLSSDRRKVSAAFREMGRQRPDPSRRMVARALEYVMLNSEERSNRRKAAEALRTWGTRASVPALIRAIDDEWTFVADVAIETLSHFPTRAALHALSVKFQDDNHRRDVVEALERIGPPAVPYIGQVLRTSRDETTRAAACDLLGRIGSPSARSVLLSVKNDPSSSVRWRAENALKKLDRRH